MSMKGLSFFLFYILFPIYVGAQQNIIHSEAPIMRSAADAAISWVDDDFSPRSYKQIKQLCDELHIKCDFALVPATDSENKYFFADSTKKYIHQYQQEGFCFEVHPPHKGWYKSKFAGIYKGKEWVEDSMKRTLEVFKRDGICHSGVLIYPGGSGTNPEVVEVASSFFSYGVMAGGGANVHGNNRMQFHRIFLNLSSKYPKSFFKLQIKEAVEQGCWVIIGTHGHDFVSDMETVDETTMSFANLREIIQYVNGLCPIKSLRYNYKHWFLENER